MNKTTDTSRITPEEFLHLPDDGKRYELVDGLLVEKNMSWMSCEVGGELFRRMANSFSREEAWHMFSARFAVPVLR